MQFTSLRKAFLALCFIIVSVLIVACGSGGGGGGSGSSGSNNDPNNPDNKQNQDNPESTGVATTGGLAGAFITVKNNAGVDFRDCGFSATSNINTGNPASIVTLETPGNTSTIINGNSGTIISENNHTIINANGNSDIDIYSKDFDINGQLAKQYTFTLETKDKQNASNAKNTYPICRVTIVICYNRNNEIS